MWVCPWGLEQCLLDTGIMLNVVFGPSSDHTHGSKQILHGVKSLSQELLSGSFMFGVRAVAGPRHVPGSRTPG